MKKIVLICIILLSCVVAQAQSGNISNKPIKADSIPHHIAKRDTGGVDKSDLVIDFAKKFLGVPYRYGGSSPAGFDCSGFVQFVLKKYGFDITRTSSSMANYGVRVKLEDVQKGDLLLFNGSRISKTTIGHVGIVMENNNGVIKFIHSANGGVQVTTLNGSRYYVPRFVMARHIEM